MQDLSNLLGDPVNVLAPTSQAGGNQVYSNDNAMTAPGSEPSAPATSADGEVLNHPAPKIVATPGKKITPGTDGMSQPKSAYAPSAPAWKNTK